MTLLEVIVAMAVFLIALAAIGQLVQIGADRALETRYHAQALQKCQGKLAEVIAGAEPLSSQNDVPYTNDDTGEWRWSMEASQDESTTKLWKVKVTVARSFNGGQVSVSLEQMVLDPSLRLANPNVTNDSGTGSGTTGTTGN